MVQLPAENSILAAAVRRAADEHRLSHAVILTGRGDLTAAARFLAAAHVCEGEHKPCLTCRHCRKALEGVHPDVISVQDTEHKELTVEAVRALRKDVYIRPNEAERKVYIIADCRQLNERDQNVLLKIVEEGPPYAAFVFCADTLHALLPTIRSRCVELRLVGGEETPGEDEAAAALCRILAKRDALALTGHLTALENRRVKREQLLAMTEGAWQITAEALLAKCGKPGGCGDAAQVLCRAFDRRQLQALTALFRRYAGECQYNVGAGHVLGALNAELIALLH